MAPASWALFKGDSGTSAYTIAVTKDNGTTTATVTGQVCVTNGGEVSTENLAIGVDLTQPPSTTVVGSTTVNVSGYPVIEAGGTHCYDYTLTVSSPVAGDAYKVTAHVTITNHSGHLATPFGPDPSDDFTWPASPTLVNNTINVTDTNGGSWSFSANVPLVDRQVGRPVVAHAGARPDVPRELLGRRQHDGVHRQ